MIYYVYHHVRCDTNQPFYVGKGKKDRITSKKNRNKHWHHIVDSAGYNAHFVCTELDEELAFLCERELIDKYRRLGYKLVNYTDGGEGQSGYKHTEESKQKMRKPHRPYLKKKILSETHKQNLSKAKIGKPSPQRGAKLSEDHKLKLSKSHKGIMAGTFWWNDGAINTRSKDCPGDGWVKGRVSRG